MIDSEVKEPLEGNYFVSAYPPFSCWKKEHVPELDRALETPSFISTDVPFGLYIHIPFCDIRCMYCYYLSYAKKPSELIERYIDALIEEMGIYRDTPKLVDRSLDFVYIGGGTPSILTEKQIYKLTRRLQELFPWSNAKEVTFECAPKSVTEAKLRVLRESGVTRISMGIQQLNDDVLKKNGRIHLVSDVEQAYATIRQVGFDVVNIDLMVGLVGESDKTFIESLEDIINMNPDSITLYQLEIPQNTPLYHALDKTVPGDSLVTWDIKRKRLNLGFARLEMAGYHLRSAYTAVRDPKYMSFAYQDEQYFGADLLGIGASAFSYIDGTHYQNLASLESYLQRINEGRASMNRAYVLNDEERLTREFILQLKLGKINGSYFNEKFDVDIFDYFKKPLMYFTDQGFLERNEDELIVIREGLLQVDRMIQAFYLQEHQGVRYS